MKKKIIDCTIRELSKICKKHKTTVDYDVCCGCKLQYYKMCMAGYPISILNLAKQKTIEAKE